MVDPVWLPCDLEDFGGSLKRSPIGREIQIIPTSVHRHRLRLRSPNINPPSWTLKTAMLCLFLLSQDIENPPSQNTKRNPGKKQVLRWNFEIQKNQIIEQIATPNKATFFTKPGMFFLFQTNQVTLSSCCFATLRGFEFQHLQGRPVGIQNGDLTWFLLGRNEMFWWSYLGSTPQTQDSTKKWRFSSFDSILMLRQNPHPDSGGNNGIPRWYENLTSCSYISWSHCCLFLQVMDFIIIMSSTVRSHAKVTKPHQGQIGRATRAGDLEIKTTFDCQLTFKLIALLSFSASDGFHHHHELHC